MRIITIAHMGKRWSTTTETAEKLWPTKDWTRGNRWVYWLNENHSTNDKDQAQNGRD